MTAGSDGGIATLISDLAQQGSTLVQTELKLLRAEVYEKLGQMGPSQDHGRGTEISVRLALFRYIRGSESPPNSPPARRCR
jgi:hypothetical protein